MANLLRKNLSPPMPDHPHPKSLATRRQVFLGGSALAVASGLASWWRYSSAAQVMPEPPDDLGDDPLMIDIVLGNHDTSHA